MARLTYSFRGFVVPVFTPFNERFLLDLTVIPNYAKYLADRGIKGILVNGTSGEGTSMSVQERKSLAEAWAGAAKSAKLHLMIQVGGAPLPDVLELARHAEEIKADSLLCLPELYFKPTENRQLVNYLKRVGEAAPKTPLLYYHVPMFTNVTLHMGEFLESIGDELASFVGIKFTSTNLEEGAQAVRANSSRFVVFLGSDQIISAACAVGMDSFIPTSVNMFPELALEILAASEKGDLKKARDKQEKLSKAVITISKYGNWVQTMKAAMPILTSVNVGPPRMPLIKLHEDKINTMKKDLTALGLSIN
ncbi:N-acetylneuraminate lyase-like [Venturia canescens]|uniref:N-acetylneuraminate lyase-like n=1 Tax=Venturia canescens TaxID=32260 RepID=UPI001C9CA172|nr:N-acetylneuraminate lyase-like [Venturia canescens]